MKRIGIALAALAAACGAPETKAPEGPAPAGPDAFEPEALVGLWSFDRSCASGDGMRLNADDTASYDEWGQGVWSLEGDTRIVLDLEVHELGVGPTGRRETIVISFTPPVTDDLNGAIEGAPPRAINARRCPE